jgi:hypothetical protein
MQQKKAKKQNKAKKDNEKNVPLPCCRRAPFPSARACPL